MDVHGHGRSSHTPGRYTFQKMGADFARFLDQVVGRPALVSGNSSGGLLSVWLAANAPEWVYGVAQEDPPLFSSEWPRLEECSIYQVMLLSLETLANPKGKDIPAFFSGFDMPVESDSKISAAAGPLLSIVSSYIRLVQLFRPDAPHVDLPLTPFPLRMMLRGFSEYDPGFTRAFVDGTAGEGFDHADALSRIRCPTLLMHANWFCTDKHGLVGAMDDDDAKRAVSLVPDCRFVRITSGHVVHQEAPKRFVQELVQFATELQEPTPREASVRFAFPR